VTWACWMNAEGVPTTDDSGQRRGSGERVTTRLFVAPAAPRMATEGISWSQFAATVDLPARTSARSSSPTRFSLVEVTETAATTW